MTALVPYLLLSLLSSGSHGETGIAEKPPAAGGWDCGTIALYNIFRLEGRLTSVDQLSHALPAPGSKGYSLRDLRRAAAAQGLRLDAVMLPRRRSSLSGPTLLYVRRDGEGHFVVARPVGHTGKLIQVLDGQRNPVIFDADRLFTSPSWTGLALIPHRTNHLAVAAGSLSVTCLLALGFRRWKRRGVPAPSNTRALAAMKAG